MTGWEDAMDEWARAYTEETPLTPWQRQLLARLDPATATRLHLDHPYRDGAHRTPPPPPPRIYRATSGFVLFDEATEWPRVTTTDPATGRTYSLPSPDPLAAVRAVAARHLPGDHP